MRILNINQHITDPQKGIVLTSKNNKTRIRRIRFNIHRTGSALGRFIFADWADITAITVKDPNEVEISFCHFQVT